MTKLRTRVKEERIIISIPKWKLSHFRKIYCYLSVTIIIIIILYFTSIKFNFYHTEHSLKSFFCTDWVAYFYCSSDPGVRNLSDSSVNSVFSWIILLFFNDLRYFSALILFLVDSYSFSIEYALFCCLRDKFPCVLLWFCLLIIEWWGKVNLNISVYDANCFIVIFRLDLHDVDLELSRKRWYCYRVSFVKAGEISQLKLQDGFRII